jgi:predicted AAA+ superfamily ATPase
MFERKIVGEILRLASIAPRRLQIVIGPRQVGKTTAARQAAARSGCPCHYASADEALPPGPEWIEAQWNASLGLAAQCDAPAWLILDEIQKVRGWSEEVKRLWDADTTGKVRPLLLGSSALLLQKGLSESLAGRFFLHRCSHWSWPEMRDAFGWDLETWLVFGGYPGAANYIGDPELWMRYISDSLIDTTLSRDILQLETVAKPALLRHLFGLATHYPSQVLSFNKMLGQLVDAGNTTTLSHYLQLFGQAFLITGLSAYSGGEVRRRASSPKLIIQNNALVTASNPWSLARKDADHAWRGRLVENAVGAALLQEYRSSTTSLYYWRDGMLEADFVLADGTQLFGIEVKSGRPDKISGLAAFKKKYPKASPLIIGSSGIPLEKFFENPKIL